MDEDEMAEDAFSSADDLSDVVLIVEEKKIFAHKSILGNNEKKTAVYFFSYSTKI
jgi:hypothetical protein